MYLGVSHVVETFSTVLVFAFPIIFVSFTILEHFRDGQSVLSLRLSFFFFLFFFYLGCGHALEYTESSPHNWHITVPAPSI